MVEKEIEIESPDEFQARGFVEVLEMAVWVASEKWSLKNIHYYFEYNLWFIYHCLDRQIRTYGIDFGSLRKSE